MLCVLCPYLQHVKVQLLLVITFVILLARGQQVFAILTTQKSSGLLGDFIIGPLARPLLNFFIK
jgi:hypothetical protein